MRIERLQVFSFPVPFKTVFRHASASRSRAENLIVAAFSDCGKVGYGEGCPRDYVTGESVAGGSAFIRGVADSVTATVSDVDSLRNWIAAHRPAIDENPAAFCAIEIAILDLLGKISECPVEHLLGAPKLAGTFAYSAVLGDAPIPIFWWQFRRYWRSGFRDFKVKISGSARRDRRKMDLLANRSEPHVRVRLDANNLWTSADDCIAYVNDLPGRAFAIEEPLQPGDLAGFKRVGEACDAKVILDESLLRPEQVDELDDAGRWLVNLRVSKMGGLIRSLRVAEIAADKGIGLIVGAQVGETSILTRAALTVMNAHRAILVAAEGAFGTHLLQRDLTTPCVMFGDGGKLGTEGKGFDEGPGLGLLTKNSDLVATP